MEDEEYQEFGDNDEYQVLKPSEKAKRYLGLGGELYRAGKNVANIARGDDTDVPADVPPDKREMFRNIFNHIKSQIEDVTSDPYEGTPVDLAFLKRFWRILYFKPFLHKYCVAINTKVKAAIIAGTKGVGSGVVVAIHVLGRKTKDTIGAILRILNGPIGAIGFGIDIRAVIDFVLKLPIIQHMLVFLRRLAMPILKVLEKATIFLNKNPHINAQVQRIMRQRFPQLYQS